MNKYYITYLTKEKDTTTVWCKANSVLEAENYVRNEYHNVFKILYVNKK